MNKCKYIIYKVGQWWYFDLRAANGQMLFTSHKYSSRRTAQLGIGVLAQLVKSNPQITFGEQDGS